MQKWPLKEIIEHAKKHSPFYRELYKDLETDKLSDLPIIDQAIFWNSEVVTDISPDGIVFKSGGSTGAPKYSYFTHLEWMAYTESFGWGMSEGIIDHGDRVGNLFYVGDLYASFLFIKDSLQSIPTSKKKFIQYPIAGQTDHIQILKIIEEFEINTIVGVPSAILTLLEKYSSNKSQYPKLKLEKILFGGEALYDDQHKALLEIFPDIKISSIGCASVDGGLIGYSSRDCKNNEHRVSEDVSIIEIVDPDTMEVITEKNKVGKVLLTNLTRKLMPIIRYPAGDLAVWIEDEGATNRKFKLQGRSEEAARLGTLSVYFEDTRDMIIKALSDSKGIQFQMILKHFDHKDELTFKISGADIANLEKTKQKIVDAFVNEKESYMDILKKNLIHPLKIEVVAQSKLEANTRTGKLKRIIDLRT
ncbi:MAG: AMP-binding protein [Bacteriovorax sp.]|nr:AMP-binding protein [Bacteriovorax sp.]